MIVGYTLRRAYSGGKIQGAESRALPKVDKGQRPKASMGTRGNARRLNRAESPPLPPGGRHGRSVFNTVVKGTFWPLHHQRLVELTGFEPVTPSLRNMRSKPSDQAIQADRRACGAAVGRAT